MIDGKGQTPQQSVGQKEIGDRIVVKAHDENAVRNSGKGSDLCSGEGAMNVRDYLLFWIKSTSAQAFTRPESGLVMAPRASVTMA